MSKRTDTKIEKRTWSKMSNENKRSELIYLIKGLAVCSVISAHCNSVASDAMAVAKVCSLILQHISTYGVICFFTLSGFLFQSDECVGVFFQKKLKRLCIPWFISATVVYLYVYLRKPPVSISTWIRFVIGDGSYCYYMSILMMLYVIFVIFPRMQKNIPLYICVVLTVVSASYAYKYFPNAYMNIFNWIGYFALGVLIRNKEEWFRNMFHKVASMRFIIYAVAVGVITFQISRKTVPKYWGGMCWVETVLGAFVLTILAKRIMDTGILRIFLKRIGVKSYWIYLWHMPIAGITAAIMNRGILQQWVLVRPIIVLLITSFSGAFLEVVAKKLKLTKFLKYVGL